MIDKIQSSVGFGRRSAVQTDALNDRLTRISPTMVRMSAKNVSARTSSTGIPRRNPTNSTPGDRREGEQTLE